MTPDWYAFTLLALASFRVWKLIGDDAILDQPRDWLLDRLARNGREARGVKWSTFLVCPWCAGFWITFAWWTAWWFWPEMTLYVATVWAISAVVGLMGTAYSAATDKQS